MDELEQAKQALRDIPLAHRKALAYFLNVAYESLGNNGCNDFDLEEIYGDDQQSASLLKQSFVKFEQEENPDEDGDHFGFVDFQVAGYLSSLVDDAIEDSEPQEPDIEEFSVPVPGDPDYGY